MLVYLTLYLFKYIVVSVLLGNVDKEKFHLRRNNVSSRKQYKRESEEMLAMIGNLILLSQLIEFFFSLMSSVWFQKMKFDVL